MSILIKEIPLVNGLVIRIYDQTRRYYGDFYHVKLEVNFEIKLRIEYFERAEQYADAERILGSSAVYRRFLEQMGVPSTGIEHVRHMLIQNFEKNSVPYFSSSDFPRKFLLIHYEKSRKRAARRAVH